jgi:hypothetical protein
MARGGGGGAIFWLGLLWLFTRKRSDPSGTVRIDAASMTSRGRTTTATQQQIDYANEEPASQPE